MASPATTVRYCSKCRTSYGDERFCPLDGGVVVEAREAGDPLIGQTLAGRYLMIRAIGQGGMGAVYEAEHVGLGKRVAVKLLLDTYTDDREVLARFHQEARTASRIGHENIIDILDIGADEPRDGHAPRTFIAMEYLEGQDLRGLCRDVGALPIPQGLHIVRQICRALDAAHAKDVIHRDMKPENVFLTARNGQRDFVKIMDFGISKIKAAHESQVRLTQTGAVIGTPLYMAPEQALGRTDIDQRADIYSVGVMMYELFCGKPPFEAPTYLALMAQHLSETPLPPRKRRAELPPALEKAILRTLEKEPEKRYQSMRELERALPEIAYTPRSIGSTTVVAGSNVLTPPQAAIGPASTKMATIAKGGRAGGGRKALIAALATIVVGGGIAVAVVMAKRGGGGAGKPQQPTAAQTTKTEPAPVVNDGPKVSPMADVGTLDVESTPAGATVILDGKEQGKTPLHIEKVPAGQHKLRLELAGYAAVEVQKPVRADVAETFFVPMSVAPRGVASSTHGAGKPPVSVVQAPADHGSVVVDPPKQPPQDQVAPPPQDKPPSGDPIQDTKPKPPVIRPTIDKKKPPADDDKKKNPYLNGT